MIRYSKKTQKMLEENYLLKDQFGRVRERPDDLFRRIAHAIANVEGQWGTLDDVEYYESEYLYMMRDLEFLPSPCILKNAGLPKGQLIESYVLPVQDSVESITQAVREMSILQKSGAGTGFSFSQIRPSDDLAESSNAQAAGPCEFINLFDTATQVLKRGSGFTKPNLAVLAVSHPDVVSFARILQQQKLSNFQFAIAITSHFMRCLKKDTTYPLVNPKNGQIVRFVPARDIFQAICEAAWKTGNPGILFIDEINRHHATPQLGQIEASGPFMDAPLLAHEGIAYGAINMANMVDDKGFDEERFEILIDLAVRFLDNCIEVSHFPLEDCERVTTANRKIGIGLMGFAELLARLKIPYDSAKAKTFATTTMKFMLKRARFGSLALAKQRGPFKNYQGSLLEKQKIGPFRNATITGFHQSDHLAEISGVSPGVLPLKSLLTSSSGENQLIDSLDELAQEAGVETEKIISHLERHGNLKKLTSLNEKFKSVYITDDQVTISDKLKMQAIFQKYVDSGVSCDYVLPKKAKLHDVFDVFMNAYQAKCKNIRVRIE